MIIGATFRVIVVGAQSDAAVSWIRLRSTGRLPNGSVARLRALFPSSPRLSAFYGKDGAVGRRVPAALILEVV
jgi:hypothetical protein